MLTGESEGTTAWKAVASCCDWKSLFRLKPARRSPLKQAQDEGFLRARGAGSSSPSTRKSPSSSCDWFSMYALIASSVTLPLLTQK